ncbi:MAG: ABC transporter substrate-binding protein, partial [Nitrososphaerota archaeon]|nr:ABC transporter substrate-binding protein [Nitrososphaerota archaeon]
PLVVPSGLPVEYAAMEMWAAALHQMDPNIEASPVYQNFNTIIGYLVPGGNPDPIIDGVGWSPDYPYPSDYVNSMYLQGGSYPVANGWTTAYVNATMGNATATQFQEMNNLILQADSTTNSTLAAQDYKQAEQIGINLYMYVYTLQENNFWIIKPYMSGYHNNIQYQENVMFGGADDSLFYWWVKG